MREILFRGKATGDGQWVYGDLRRFSDCTFICSDVQSTFVDPETVGEFTGLTDKNGTKVFEGDIVKARSGFDEYIGVVKYYEQYSGFYVLVEDEFGAADLRLGCDHTIAVIGNKWDNADLLEGKNG